MPKKAFPELAEANFYSDCPFRVLVVHTQPGSSATARVSAQSVNAAFGCRHKGRNDSENSGCYRRRRLGGVRHRIDMRHATGRHITIYDQTEVTRDLMTARATAGQLTIYDAADVHPAGFDGASPSVTYGYDRLRFHCGLRRIPWHLPAKCLCRIPSRI